MTKPPAFQWYAKEWLTDDKRTEMTVAQRGAYADLLSYQWVNGSIPEDLEAVRVIIGVEMREMKALWTGRLVEAFPVVDGRRLNPRLESYRQELKELKTKRRRSGKRGADSRWHGKPNGKPIASDDNLPSVCHRQNDGPASASAIDTVPNGTVGEPTKDEPTDWKTVAGPALREAGVPERSIGDAIKNFWGPARESGVSDEDLAGLVRWKWKRGKGQPWNPAAMWNVRNAEMSKRFRWALGQYRKNQETGSFAKRVSQGGG